jgi:pimeloyl-ACP methyl ester carboxylesterase
MATFVLIHGSWHWGGCYLKVANSLAAKGHVVSCPDLLTLGFDPTPPGTVPDLPAYLGPAKKLVEAAKEKVIVLGHSMGGVSVSYLGETMPDKIKRLVYLCAFLCPPSKTANDYLFSEDFLKDPMVAEFNENMKIVPKGVQMTTSNLEFMKTAFYNDCSDHDVSVAVKNVSPIGPLVANVWAHETTKERFGRLPITYIECLQDKAIPIKVQKNMQNDVRAAFGIDIDTKVMDASHSPFLSQPEKLADILDGLAYS